MKKPDPLIEEAKDILNGKRPSSDIFLLLTQLKNQRYFGYARKLLIVLGYKGFAQYLTVLQYDQERAICTYKDSDLPLSDRLDTALSILRDESPSLSSSKNVKTLGIAGSIFKKKWELDGNKQNLERSFEYYSKGYHINKVEDFGYNGINAAFVLDVLSKLESEEAKKAGSISTIANHHSKEATQIRKELIEALPQSRELATQQNIYQEWTLLVTIGEAFFGLKLYEEASVWLKEAKGLCNNLQGQEEHIVRQLAQLALMQEELEPQDMVDTEAWNALLLFVNNADALKTAFSGKAGLALSGGGFRASLYHIGVLARLAELDMLRSIEVLSCVSGGSIVGAYYYLEIRELLQNKTDDEITQQDYLNIVKNISIHFLKGVQRNLRTRVASNWIEDVKMLFSANYSRTDRIGQLYETELFNRIDAREKDYWMDNICIYPKINKSDNDKNFSPRNDNWKRKNKVPILILNATALNTGHNWQVTASWMGEPPASIQSIDSNYRLRRTYYETGSEAINERRIRLGAAVAASSCVPGLFDPLALTDLYEGKKVKLVDGGVHDNQGICGLLEQNCSVLLVSDASGQMTSDDDPGSNPLSVTMRTNSILMERVRNAQYQDLISRYRAGVLKGLMFIHLKLDLEVKTVDWRNCDDPSDQTLSGNHQSPLTFYGINKNVQAKLASIRTDLDSFNDVEAYSLMTSGYLMVNAEFGKCVSSFEINPACKEEWNFLQVADMLKLRETPQRVNELLTVSESMFFKIWKLNKGLKLTAEILAFCTLILSSYVCYLHWDKSLVKVNTIIIPLLSFLATLILGKWLVQLIRLKSYLTTFLLKLGMVTLGFVLANLHLMIFDKWYLKAGYLKPVKSGSKLVVKSKDIQKAKRVEEPENV